MHKQTGILLTLPHTYSLSFSLSISVFCSLSFCLHLWHFFCLNKAHKFVLVVCATFLLRIFIMCLLLRFVSVAKSMLHIFPLLVPWHTCHAPYHTQRPAQITTTTAPRCKLHYLQSDASRRLQQQQQHQHGLCGTLGQTRDEGGIRGSNLLIRTTTTTTRVVTSMHPHEFYAIHFIARSTLAFGCHLLCDNELHFAPQC